MNSSTITDRNPTDRNHFVTAVITHRVRAGREQGYEEWIKSIAAAAREFAGHLGATILRPQPGSPSDYVIVLRFDSCDRLQSWLKSDIRKAWIDRAQPLIQAQETIQILTGMESWFQLPQPAGSPAPKRYKQAILVWVGVMIVSLAISPLVAPLLAPLPRLLQIAVNVAITVALLTYVIMPQLTRWFKGWLFRSQ
ncbi:MAG: antibiotic biosynthesis monooxygenase [Elainellaceae cyanobacterium]